MAKLAVQIVTYNSHKDIQACLEALQNQTFQDFEIIFVDNASQDETVKLVKSLGYTSLVLEQNLGYAGAHNIALKQTQSDYVLTLNPDVILIPTFVEKMIDIMDSDLRLGSTSGCLILANDEADSDKHIQQIDSCGVVIDRKRQQRLLFHGEPVHKLPQENIPILGPDGAAAFYRRAMLNDIAVFDEVFDTSFFMHKEDIDICWRAAMRGWLSLCVVDAVAYHRRSFRPGYQNRKRVSPDLQKYAVRNRYFLLLKNETPVIFWQNIGYILAYEIKIWVYIIFFERQSLWAITSFLQNYRELLKKRRYIQKNAKGHII